MMRAGERGTSADCLFIVLDVDVGDLQSVISVIGRVLEAFDDDNIIPAYGFGDIRTKDNGCFPFKANPGCRGFAEVLQRYTEITPTLKLSGPTNFAPVIKEAIRTVERETGYHILVIIADGQVTNVEQTRQAIVEASNWPICAYAAGLIMEVTSGLLTSAFVSIFQRSSWSAWATGHGK